VLLPDLWIASAMAVALGAMLSTTASAPTDTMAADFTRELRIVLRLTENLPRELGRIRPQARALGALHSHACHVASVTDAPSFHIRRLNNYDSVRVIGEDHPCGLNALSQADSGVVPAFQRNVIAAGDCRRREAPPQGRSLAEG
jgi:hypothetical protein